MRKKRTMGPAQRAKIRAGMLAHQAAKRGPETPEQQAAREATTTYQREWRATRTREQVAKKTARDKAWRARKQAERRAAKEAT